MSATTAPAGSGPSPPDRRTIRTFARREDADRALDVLREHGIESTVQEFRVNRTDGEPGTVSRGCVLGVAPADAADAARLLMRMAPSESADRAHLAAAAAAAESRTRRPRPLAPRRTFRQSNALWILLIAIGCSAAAMFYMVYALFQPDRPRLPAAPGDTGNYTISEDLDWDGAPDIEREFTADGALLQVREDRDGDGEFELRWNYERGAPTSRTRDIDRNGVSDERTVFDAAGEPFYVDLRPNAQGPVVNRRVYREGVLWKILDDADADTHFDRIREYAVDGSLLRDDPLPRGSPENDPPKPEKLPPAPPAE